MFPAVQTQISSRRVAAENMSGHKDAAGLARQGQNIQPRHMEARATGSLMSLEHPAIISIAQYKAFPGLCQSVCNYDAFTWLSQAPLCIEIASVFPVLVHSLISMIIMGFESWSKVQTIAVHAAQAHLAWMSLQLLLCRSLSSQILPLSVLDSPSSSRPFVRWRSAVRFGSKRS